MAGRPEPYRHRLRRRVKLVGLQYEARLAHASRCRVGLGTEVADEPGMTQEQGRERKGAQQENAAERGAKKNPSKKQDLEKPPEGRDEPPAGTVTKDKRDPDSPWMGGG